MIQRILLSLSMLGLISSAAAPSARAQHFGRNKVQYRAFDFKVLRTEHFDIYFYPQERQAALDAARMVERGYARMSRILQHEFRDRKPIILYASHTDFEQTNAIPDFVDEGTGAFVEPLKERMVIPLTGSYAYFERVLLHELAHQFQFDILLRGAGAGAGLGNPSGGAIGLYWFREGMAEYLALGQIDPHTQSWVRDAALSGYLRSIGEMNRRHDYLSYRFGQALWAYIGANWGDEVIGILLQKSLRTGIERAFVSTLGISLEQLSQEWMEAVRKTYLPTLTEYESPSRFAEPLVQRTKYEEPWYLAPAISPAGDLMVFLSQREGFGFDMWLADARTGEIQEKLIEGESNPDFESLRYMSSSADFSADGRYLAFSAKVGGQDALYIYDVTERKIVEKLRFDLNAIEHPSWAPDNRHIAFSGLDGGLSDLFITDLDGNLRRLTNDRYADLVPSWSPDGKTIAFTTDRGEETDFGRLTMGEYRIGLYHLDSGEIELLPRRGGNSFNPVWAPDSRSLVWVGDRTGVHNLYLFDLDENELFQITNVLSGVIGITPLSPTLSWARDAGRLLFVYFEEAGYSIYAIDDPRTLTRIPVSDRPPEPPVVVAEARPPEPAPGPEPMILELERSDRDPRITSYYRGGDGFRPSAELPEPSHADAGPVSVAALLDSAEYALPDTSAFEIRDYSVKFSPDMIGRPTIGAQAGGYYGNGIYGGSFISLSDMLGNHNIGLAASINGSFSDAMFFSGYNFLKTRANYGVAIQQVPLYGYAGRQAFIYNGDNVIADIFQRDVIRSAQGIVSYPFSQFRRVELSAAGVYYKRDLIFRGINYSRGGRGFSEDERVGDIAFFEPSVALVFDNALFGYTGPVHGRRYRIQASHTFGDFSFAEGLVDFRNYFNYKRWAVFAARFLGLTRIGSGADTFIQYWGGPYFLRGYDSDSFSIDSPECAYARDQNGGSTCPAREQLIGSSAAIMNLELRFPVITELQIGFLGNFPPVDAVLFFDGGLVWSDQYCSRQAYFGGDIDECDSIGDVKLVWDRRAGENPLLVREPLFSTGVGLRINVFYTILRFDYAFPLSRQDRGGVFSFSIGPSF